ncbi:MAG: tetratricopeptide repeat protein [Desulfobacterales bacterium]|jgi:tetratricopeptide (TPR) repeat protein
MSRRLLGGALLTIALLSIWSCAPDLTVQKKQEKASRNLGEAYYQRGNYTEALREFLKAESLYPDDPFLQNDLGLAYKAKKQPDLAIEHFKKALKINPDYAPAKNNLGTAYLDKGDWDTAIKYFKSVSKNLLYTTPHLPLANLGWAYYNKKEYHLAEKYYREALDLKPKFINAMRGLGLTYMAMGKLDDAAQILESAVKNYPDVYLLYLDLGKVYTESGEEDKALAAYQKVIELDPGSESAAKASRAIQDIKRYHY